MPFPPTGYDLHTATRAKALPVRHHPSSPRSEERWLDGRPEGRPRKRGVRPAKRGQRELLQCFHRPTGHVPVPSVLVRATSTPPERSEGTRPFAASRFQEANERRVGPRPREQAGLRLLRTGASPHVEVAAVVAALTGRGHRRPPPRRRLAALSSPLGCVGGLGEPTTAVPSGPGGPPPRRVRRSGPLGVGVSPSAFHRSLRAETGVPHRIDSRTRIPHEVARRVREPETPSTPPELPRP